MSLTPDLEHLIGRLAERLDELLAMQPLEYELGELSHIVGRERDTLRKHLIGNYRDGVDYWQKAKKGKIYVARPAAIQIRRHYARSK